MNTVDLLRTLEDEFFDPALCAGRLEFDGRSEPVEVLSLSAHSADLRCSNEIAEDGRVTLVIDGFRSFEGDLVRRHGCIIGMMFAVDQQAGTKVARSAARAGKAKRAAASAKKEIGLGLESAAVPGPQREGSRAMRVHARSAVFWSGAVQAGRENVDCIVLNMSPGGAKIRLLKRFVSDGSPVILHIDRLGGYASEVIWLEGNIMGLRFLKDPREVAADIEQGLRKASPPA